MSVRTRNTLVLTDAALASSLGINFPLALSRLERTQEIGAAAHLLEFDSLLVPSARWSCSNLVLLSEHFDVEAIRLKDPTPLNFPAWRELHAEAFDQFQDMLRGHVASSMRISSR